MSFYFISIGSHFWLLLYFAVVPDHDLAGGARAVAAPGSDATVPGHALVIARGLDLVPGPGTVLIAIASPQPETSLGSVVEAGVVASLKNKRIMEKSVLLLMRTNSKMVPLVVHEAIPKRGRDLLQLKKRST